MKKDHTSSEVVKEGIESMLWAAEGHKELKMRGSKTSFLERFQVAANLKDHGSHYSKLQSCDTSHFGGTGS